MTLAQALAAARQQANQQVTARKRELLLVCGFEPLHLKTFLEGQFAERQNQALVVRTGLYGDLQGSAGPDCEAAAVVLEWSQLDSRLGLRSAGGWGLSVQSDIIATCRDQFVRLRVTIEALAAKMPVCVSAPTLSIPFFSHTAGWQISPNQLELQKQLASFLADAAKLARVSILNPSRLDNTSSSVSRLDAQMEISAGFPYTLEHASALAGQIIQVLFPPNPMKGLITDLDGTLWSGIVGEVGANGVHWSLSERAQVHGLYQQLLRHFSEAGVLLAIASKNELSVIEETLQRQDLFVPAKAFFPVRADWGPKSHHIREILRTWNIGADGVVFVDDSAMELSEVKAAFPAMTCLQFVSKPAAQTLELFETLRDLFGKAVVHGDDALRQTSIRAGQAFEESAKNVDPDEFLRSLQGRVTFDAQKDAGNQRLLELVNKTNQFNLNGVRLSDADWLRHLNAPQDFVIGVSYEDKFGPLGVIGVVAGTRSADWLEISTWVMSCRAFSRRLEFHTLDYLFQASGARQIVLAYQLTARNQPLREFLESMKMSADASGNWILSKDAFFGTQLPHLVSVKGPLAPDTVSAGER